MVAIGQEIHVLTHRAEDPERIYSMSERSFNPPPANADGLPPEQSMSVKDAAAAESGE